MKQDDDNENIQGEPERFDSDQLRNTLERMKAIFGDDRELIKQAFADVNALDRQNLRNHFEARQKYTDQVAELNRIALNGLREYGLQTLKWLFLLNAGAIGIVLAYLAGKAGGASSAAFLKALWPFAVGCVMVVLAGATAYFNFSYAEETYPSPEQLHAFVDPKSKTWPFAKSQKENESATEFYGRIGSKTNTMRYLAIGFASGAGFFFAYGVFRVLWAVLHHASS